MSEEEHKFRGHNLIRKIQWGTFLILYFLMFPLLDMISPSNYEGGVVPQDRVDTFNFIILIIVFIVLIEVAITQKIDKEAIRRKSGMRVLRGRVCHGNGRTEGLDWVIKRMFLYGETPKGMRIRLKVGKGKMYDEYGRIIRIKNICPECNIENWEPDAKYCPKCGAKMKVEVEKNGS